MQDVHANLKIVDTTKMQQLVIKHGELKMKNTALETKLDIVSSHGTLVPNCEEAEAKVKERKIFLNKLKTEITLLHDTIT